MKKRDNTRLTVGFWPMLLLLPLLMLAACTKGEGNDEVITPKEPDPAVTGKDTTGQVTLPPDSSDRPIAGTIISSAIRLRVSDAQGSDLLNPTSTSPQAVDAAQIKLYYVKDGKEELHYNAMSDVPTGIHLETPEQTWFPYYTIKVSLNHVSKEAITTTILEWPDGRRDVIKTEFFTRQEEPNANIIMKRVWLNDKLILDRPNRIGSIREAYEIKR